MSVSAGRDLGQGRDREAVDILAAEVARGVLPGAPIRGYLAYGLCPNRASR